MPDVKGLVLGQMRSGQAIIEMLTRDLAEVEYFKAPVEGANHIGWVLGHIACTEERIVAAMTEASQRMPRAMHELFQSGSVCVGDASKYPTRSEIDDLFLAGRAATLEALEAFDLAK